MENGILGKFYRVRISSVLLSFLFFAAILFGNYPLKVNTALATTSPNIYPDAGNPGTTTCDGTENASQNGDMDGVNWANLYGNSPSTTNYSAEQGSSSPLIGIGYIGNSDGGLTLLDRGVAFFNLGTNLPAGATITGVDLKLYGYYKNGDYSPQPSLGIVSASQASTTQLPQGYTAFAAFGSTLLAPVMSYSSFNTSGYNDFVFNSTGVAAAQLAYNAGGILGLGFRDDTNDIPNNAALNANYLSDLEGFDIWDRNSSYGAARSPYVVITYTSTIPVTAVGTPTGTPIAGSVLTAGALTPGGATVTYQWQESSTSGGAYSNIPSATSSTYTVSGSYAGDYLEVQVTGTGSYSGTVNSGYVGPVTIPVAATAISGVTAPVTGATPVTAVTPGTGYTGAVSWSPSVASTFLSNTAYTATITLSPTAGYTMTGVTANQFTIAGSTGATNLANSGTITGALFPATATTVNTAAIVGVTAPATGNTPTSLITATSEYTAAISWSPSDNPFASNTAYTATITIMPKAGYTLSGVPLNYFTVSGTTATNPAGSGVVSALFPATATTYTLTYTAGTGGTITGSSPQTVNSGSSGTAVTASPNAHYHFVSWSDGILTATRTDTNITSDFTASATFAIDTYTLTYSTGAGGSIVGSSPQTVNYNASGTAVTATPNAHYHFVSWSDGGLTAARTDLNVTADHAYTATFAIDTHTLTYTAGANGTITGTTPQTVNYGTNGAQVTAVPDSGYQFVNWSDLSTDNPRTDASVIADLTITANFTAVASTGGASKANVIVYPPSLAIQTPAGGGSYNAGSVLGLSWSAANGAFVKYKVYYSIDNGISWTTISDNATSTALSWTVPNVSTTAGAIKVEGYDPNGNLLAMAVSTGSFTIVGTTAAPPAVALPTVTPPVTPPAIDSTVAGTYDVSTARGNNPNFNTDMNIPAATTTTACVSGTLIKNKTLPAVYYCGADGKRYVFVNDKDYFSWYPDFSNVQTISDATLGSITIGGNITYRPGTRMVKIQSDPKVYAVARGGVLRWVSTEAIARALFGDNWNKLIDDVSDAFFVNYRIGDPIVP